MSKKTHVSSSAKRRVMSNVAKQNGGSVPKGSYASRLERAHDKGGNSGK